MPRPLVPLAAGALLAAGCVGPLRHGPQPAHTDEMPPAVEAAPPDAPRVVCVCADPSTRAEAPTAPPEPPPAAASALPLGPLLLYLGGGVALAVGAGAHTANGHQQEALDALAVSTPRNRELYNDLRLELDSSYYAAIAGYTLGALALTAGLVWHIVDATGAGEVALAPTGRGLAIGGRF